VTRRTVRVELDRRSAVVNGPRLEIALRRAGARWHWHETRQHRAVRVHPDDLDDVIAAAESDQQHVVVVDRDGNPVPYGGLLGGGQR
jgi:hypothetical protein